MDDELYDFEDLQVEYVITKWRDSFLEENIIRELARNDPWSSLWRMKEKVDIKLFFNNETCELTENQKNLVMWSQLYDNIQESMEAPSQKVIEDDDVLDGWFVAQSKKREKEQKERECESNTSDKMKKHQELFMMSGSAEETEIIESMNDMNAARIKKQRGRRIMDKGQVKQHEFEDELLDKRAEINSQYSNRMRGN